MSHQAEPVGGRMFTPVFKVLLFLVALGFVLIGWRFLAGLGPTTGLNDGYAWGLWIAFDVVTGTALACGGFAVALLVYILNKGQYHPLVRPALLTSALGYSVAAIGIVVDVGRPWVIHRIPLWFLSWNVNSVMLEVALCVMAYIVVLWIELSPAFLEKFRESRSPLLKSVAGFGLPVMEKALLWIVALGILLPTMHQSSLGSVMLLAGEKLHRLWQTPLIPFHFLISCIAMGYAVVVFESTLSSVVFKRQRETRMLANLSVAAVVTILIHLGVRLVELIVRGRIGLAFAFDLYAAMFWIEVALFLVPAIMLMSRERRENAGSLFRAAMMIMLGGSLYRFDTYIVAFNPGAGWRYFPTVPEILISVGYVALEVVAYVVIVKTFPILGGTRTAVSHS